MQPADDDTHGVEPPIFEDPGAVDEVVVEEIGRVGPPPPPVDALELAVPVAVPVAVAPPPVIPDDGGWIDGDTIFLPRMNNQSCWNAVKKNDGTWPRSAGRYDAHFQAGSLAEASNIHDFFDEFSDTNEYLLNIEQLKIHLHELKIEYQYGALQKYMPDLPTGPVNLSLWETNFQKIEQLEASYPDSLPFVKFHVKHRHWDSSPDLHEDGRGTDEETQSAEVWRLFVHCCLPNLSRPFFKKETTTSGFRYILEFRLRTRFEVDVEERLPLLPLYTRQLISRNRLVLGAPGTGKSYKLEQDAISLVILGGGNSDVNITPISFHPSTTYGDFLGQYRPNTVYLPTNPGYVTVDGVPYPVPGEPMIDYAFVPGHFMNSLVKALSEPDQYFVLLIDEINRANISEVFGEVFQMLERKPDGEGKYPSSLSNEAMAYLRSKVNTATSISVTDKVKIPSNLFIWATMNPNDQSVHRFDSAFSRRWSNEYVSIDEGMELSEADNPRVGAMIESPIEMTWKSFIITINRAMDDNGIGEDDLIGMYYLEVREIVSWNHFYPKVIFHLANNILKRRLRILFKEELNTVKKIMGQCRIGISPFRDDLFLQAVGEQLEPVVEEVVEGTVVEVTEPVAEEVPVETTLSAEPLELEPESQLGTGS
jgi:hypothetical protein